MNVFYVGPKNPVSISVPGVASENISATITGSGNTISKKSNGKYEVKLSNGSPRNVEVRVSAKMPNGEMRSMGAMPFVVKKLPKPYAEVGTVSVNKSVKPRSQIRAYGTVKAKYDPSFAFQGLPLTVSKFTIEVYRGNVNVYEKTVNGNVIPASAKQFFRNLRRGDVVYFSKIRGKDVTGNQLKLNDVIVEAR
jgi:hypothetical protein